MIKPLHVFFKVDCHGPEVILNVYTTCMYLYKNPVWLDRTGCIDSMIQPNMPNKRQLFDSGPPQHPSSYLTVTTSCCIIFAQFQAGLVTMAIKWPWLHFTQVYDRNVSFVVLEPWKNNKLNCSWKLCPKVLQHNGHRKQMMWRCVKHVILLVQKSYPPMPVRDLIENFCALPKKVPPSSLICKGSE